jgi:hypothetical protein
LEKANIDLGLLGFSADELQEFFPGGAEGQVDPDDVPEPPDEPITRAGDLYSMGNHRLLCGNSCQSDDVDRLLGGAPVHLVNTDPLYNRWRRVPVEQRYCGRQQLL